MQLIKTSFKLSPEIVSAAAETVSDNWLSRHIEDQVNRENEIIEAIGNEVFAQLRTQILIAQEIISEETNAA